MERSKMTVREICHIGIFTAVIVICAQIAIPLPGMVPFTLQTWAIVLAGLALGPKNGTIAVLAYVLLGAVGAPVFANFSGGMGIVLGRTGGFILSFPIMALLAGLGERKGGAVWVVSALVAGTIINWACGMLYFSFVMSSGLQAAFAMAVAPFIPSGILRIIMLPMVAKSIKIALAKARVTL